MTSRHVAIAGAGIAGLTVALCLAQKGLTVSIFETAERLEEVGAGLQISPNAARVLARIGVLERMGTNAVRPSAITLKDAATLGTLASVPLGRAAEERWRAPYVVAHRADLQRALLDVAETVPAITLHRSTQVEDALVRDDGATLTVSKKGQSRLVDCSLLVGADGVWSRLRRLAGGRESSFTGYAAFRTVVSGRAMGDAAASAVGGDAVTAFLAPSFHMVAYPVRGGKDINLVLVARSAKIARGWANAADVAYLLEVTRGAAEPLADAIRKAGAWTSWPLHTVDRSTPWTRGGGLALIGDAAHAITPFAAQGAAMAIEDAAALAELFSGARNVPAALSRFERQRKARVERVARRGSFNRFAWHASGPVAVARNLVLKYRPQSRLMADLDWLYGHDAEREAETAHQSA